MSAANYSEHCVESSQQIRVPCCCTVAQAARSGHHEEITELIRSGTHNFCLNDAIHTAGRVHTSARL